MSKRILVLGEWIQHVHIAVFPLIERFKQNKREPQERSRKLCVRLDRNDGIGHELTGIFQSASELLMCPCLFDFPNRLVFSHLIGFLRNLLVSVIGHKLESLFLHETDRSQVELTRDRKQRGIVVHQRKGPALGGKKVSSRH